MIRHATLEDLENMLFLAQEFHEMSGMPGDFNTAHALQFGAAAIENEDCAVIVSPGGMLIGSIITPMFDPNWRIAVELIWYAEDKNGLRLLRAFKDWALDMDADEIRLSSINHIGDAVQRYALRNGYTPAEQSYSLLT